MADTVVPLEPLLVARWGQAGRLGAELEGRRQRRAGLGASAMA